MFTINTKDDINVFNTRQCNGNNKDINRFIQHLCYNAGLLFDGNNMQESKELMVLRCSRDVYGNFYILLNIVICICIRNYLWS